MESFSAFYRQYAAGVQSLLMVSEEEIPLVSWSARMFTSEIYHRSMSCSN